MNEERIGKVEPPARSTPLSAHAKMLFYCECDAAACHETISISAEEYQRVHSKTKYFPRPGKA